MHVSERLLSKSFAEYVIMYNISNETGGFLCVYCWWWWCWPQTLLWRSFFWEKLLRMRKQEANIQHAIHWDDGPLQISDWIECIQWMVEMVGCLGLEAGYDSATLIVKMMMMTTLIRRRLVLFDISVGGFLETSHCIHICGQRTYYTYIIVTRLHFIKILFFLSPIIL